MVGNRLLKLEEKMKIGKLETKEQVHFLSPDGLGKGSRMAEEITG